MTRHQFTPDEQQKGSQAGVVARREAMARRAMASEVAYRLVTEMDDVAPAALSATFSLLQKVEAGTVELPVESWLDAQRAANTAEIAHRISRLASGQSTSNVAHASVTDDERAERIAQLRATLQQHDTTSDDTTPDVTPPD